VNVGGGQPRTVWWNVRERAALPDRNLTFTVRLCRPGDTDIRAEYRFPRWIVLVRAFLPSSVNLTDAIRVPLTRETNAPLTQAGALLSLALTLAAFTWAEIVTVVEVLLPPASLIVIFRVYLPDLAYVWLPLTDGSVFVTVPGVVLPSPQSIVAV
jgi:hypothetical protein